MQVFFLLKSQPATFTAYTADSTGRPFSLASFWPADTAGKRLQKIAIKTNSSINQRWWAS